MPYLWSLLSPNKFALDHLMKVEQSVSDVIAVESPDRAERAILRVFCEFFGKFRPFLWLGSHFVK